MDPVPLLWRDMRISDLPAVNAMLPRWLQLKRRRVAEDMRDSQRFFRVCEAGADAMKARRRVYGGDAVSSIAGMIAGGVFSCATRHDPDAGFSLSLTRFVVHPIWQHLGVGRQIFDHLKSQLRDGVRSMRIHCDELPLAFFLLRMGCEARAYNVAYSVEGITENHAEYEFSYPPGSRPWAIPTRAYDFRLQVSSWGEPSSNVYEGLEDEDDPTP